MHLIPSKSNKKAYSLATSFKISNRPEAPHGQHPYFVKNNLLDLFLILLISPPILLVPNIALENHEVQ